MSSIGAAEWNFRVDRKKIREWIQNESKTQIKVSLKNRGSLQRNQTKVEERLKIWI